MAAWKALSEEGHVAWYGGNLATRGDAGVMETSLPGSVGETLMKTMSLAVAVGELYGQGARGDGGLIDWTLNKIMEEFEERSRPFPR
jgi:hypothetical protein